jgi:hypothetical protein
MNKFPENWVVIIDSINPDATWFARWFRDNSGIIVTHLYTYYGFDNSNVHRGYNAYNNLKDFKTEMTLISISDLKENLQ